MDRARCGSQDRIAPRYVNCVPSLLQTFGPHSPIIASAATANLKAVLDEATRITSTQSPHQAAMTHWGEAPPSRHANERASRSSQCHVPEIQTESAAMYTFRPPPPPVQNATCYTHEAVPNRFTTSLSSSMHQLRHPWIRSDIPTIHKKRPPVQKYASATVAQSIPVHMKLRKPSPAHRKRVVQIDPATGKSIRVFRSMREAAKSVRVTGACIGNACHGRRPSAGGFGWKIAAPDDNLVAPSRSAQREPSSTYHVDLSDETEQELSFHCVGMKLGHSRSNERPRRGLRPSAAQSGWKIPVSSSSSDVPQAQLIDVLDVSHVKASEAKLLPVPSIIALRKEEENHRLPASKIGWNIITAGAIPDKVAPSDVSESTQRPELVVGEPSHRVRSPTPPSDNKEPKLAPQRRDMDMSCAQPEQVPAGAVQQMSNEPDDLSMDIDAKFLSMLDDTPLPHLHDDVGSDLERLLDSFPFGDWESL